jgi:NADPH-dependent 2,4-dienoyl-CoA reductase/sulfur reductase-like enzyme
MSTVIIGAGQAGGHAAVALRDAGYAGRIVLVGEEAERPYERPPLSKQMLIAPEPPPVAYFHPEAHYTARDITLMLGVRATGIDAAGGRVHLADGQPLACDHLVLATGGRARRLSVPGAEQALYLRTLDDARRLRPLLLPGTRVVCIGAGVIGLEIAASAVARGCAVSVVEVGPTVMGRSLPPAVAEWMAALHRRHGVSLHLGTGVAEIGAGQVRTTEGEQIAADIVIAGIGMERNTELAAAAGVALDVGIAVDEYGRTNLAGIYAAGDVAAFWVPRLQRRLLLETWRHAQDHGAAVGRGIAGKAAPYDEIPWFWTDQHGVNLQMAGTAEGAALRVVRGAMDTNSFSVWLLDLQSALLGVVGINAPRDVRAGMTLMRAGRPVDPARIADTSISAQVLARA